MKGSHMSQETYRVYTNNFSQFEEAMKKLAKRAKKLSCPVISFEIVGEVKEPVIRNRCIVGWHHYTEVVLTGDVPRIPGWEFVGIIDDSDDTTKGFLIMLSPRIESLPQEFRNSIHDNPMRCDHCKTNHRRVKTYIVRNTETQEFFLVGRSCLKDFTGHKSPKLVAQYFSYIKSIDSLFETDGTYFGSGGIITDQDVHTFLTRVCVLVRKNGFRANKDSHEEVGLASTSDTAWWTLNRLGADACTLNDELNSETTDDDRATAKAVLDFAETMWEGKDNRDLSEYVYNMKSAIGKGLVSHKTKGLVASLYVCYDKDCIRKAEEKLQPKLEKSNYFGQLKKRYELNLTCFFTRFIDSFYGTSQLCKFYDENGNVFVWFNTSANEMEKEKSYYMKGTVKKHSEYKGMKETQLTRCAIIQS